MHAYADRSRATTVAGLSRLGGSRAGAHSARGTRCSRARPGPTRRAARTFREARAALPAHRRPRASTWSICRRFTRSARASGRDATTRSVAEPGDPGSPWAIGSAAGGHTAVEPGLGTLDDFDAFREEAERLGLEIALDLAWQCSPDHPWVREHPDWFRHRPDGTIKYAENPPKKYQDIYPLDFECDDWRGAVAGAARRHAVLDRSRRAHLPRRQPAHQDVRLLGVAHRRGARRAPATSSSSSEAFTRPTVMRYLAKAGFTQSYTYFTWRNTKAELTEYFTELTATEAREYLRPNLFANTPDILHAYLQHGGRPAFEARLLLAATLGASYGIYSGFELCENRPVRPAPRSTPTRRSISSGNGTGTGPATSRSSSRRVNAIRHAAPRAAVRLGRCGSTRPTTREIIAFSKTRAGARIDDDRCSSWSTSIRTTCSTGSSRCPLGTAGRRPYTGPRPARRRRVYTWRGEWNYVRFDPDVRQGHVLKLNQESGITNLGMLLMRRTCDPADAARRVRGATTIRSGTRTRSSTRRTSSRSSTATNDGIGDFQGLTQKLDYLQGLGITCLWLLPFFPSPLRDDGYDIADYLNVHPSYGTLDDFKAFVARRARAQHQGADRAGRQPHLGSASVVPARAPRAARIARARVLRLERHRPEVSGDADHLHRHREVELDLRPGRAAVLLAPLLLASARPEPQQPGGRRRGDRRDEVLARHRRRRAAARRRAVPVRARRDEQREPARDARRAEAHPARARRRLPEPHAARRGEPVAGRRARRTSATATSATWRSTSR